MKKRQALQRLERAKELTQAETQSRQSIMALCRSFSSIHLTMLLHTPAITEPGNLRPPYRTNWRSGSYELITGGTTHSPGRAAKLCKPLTLYLNLNLVLGLKD